MQIVTGQHMNTITIIVTILVLWLVTGLGFLSAYANAKRSGKPPKEILTLKESLLFFASLAIPLLLGFIRLIS